MDDTCYVREVVRTLIFPLKPPMLEITIPLGSILTQSHVPITNAQECMTACLTTACRTASVLSLVLYGCRLGFSTTVQNVSAQHTGGLTFRCHGTRAAQGYQDDQSILFDLHREHSCPAYGQPDPSSGPHKPAHPSPAQHSWVCRSPRL